jgi:serine/threonine protein kinase
MWSERDRRLAQVLIQAKAVTIDCVHKARALVESRQDVPIERPLSWALEQMGLLTPDKLRGFEKAASVPYERPVTKDDTRDVLPSSKRKKRRRLRSIGGYEVICALASGASGTVYKARDSRTKELFALKVLNRVDANERGAERFLREAQVACELQQENLVRGHHIGKDNGLYFFVMELVEGESVGARLRREGALPEEEVVAIGRAVCRALECARGHAIVHRDVKPDNILIDVEGRVKLCDLGLARPFGRPTNVTESGIAVGTPRYIAPEQAKGDPRTDHRADLYSLGITLFHLVTGQVPFDGESGLDVISKHIYEQVPSIRSIRGELTRELDYVILRSTRKHPRNRYETAGDMLRDLDVIAARLHQRQLRARTGDPKPHAPQERTRREV